jgi:hypothetical protein
MPDKQRHPYTHSLGGIHPLVLLGFAIAMFLSFWNIGFRPGIPIQFRRPPGVLAPDYPVQGPKKVVLPWEKDNAKIIPLASYSIRGRVLMNIPYRGRNDNFQLSPLDLVITWGRYSDTIMLQQFSFSHSYRVVSWMPKTNMAGDLNPFLSHMHIIPANDGIRSVLEDMGPEDIVSLDGHLVSVEAPGMMPWTSSLSRTDNGNGACEIYWVDKALIESRRPSFWEFWKRKIFL